MFTAEKIQLEKIHGDILKISVTASLESIDLSIKLTFLKTILGTSMSYSFSARLLRTPAKQNMGKNYGIEI